MFDNVLFNGCPMDIDINTHSSAAFSPNEAIDLRSYCGTVKDVRGTNACVAVGLASALELLQNVRGNSCGSLSAAWLYWWGRKAWDIENRDAGMRVSDGLDILKKKGICLEEEWPFDKSKILEKPPKKTESSARKRRLFYFRKLGSLKSIREAISKKQPVIFAIDCRDSILREPTTSTGVIEMPSGKKLGLHAMIIVGDDNNGRFIIQNSWGSIWGDHGFGTIPYDYAFDSRGKEYKWARDHWAIAGGGAF